MKHEQAGRRQGAATHRVDASQTAIEQIITDDLFDCDPLDTLEKGLCPGRERLGVELAGWCVDELRAVAHCPDEGPHVGRHLDRLAFSIDRQNLDAPLFAGLTLAAELGEATADGDRLRQHVVRIIDDQNDRQLALPALGSADHPAHALCASRRVSPGNMVWEHTYGQLRGFAGGQGRG